MSTNNTIKFNVGGKHFEVSRDLIEAHSETMLGKLVSEAWQADPEETVFIDRNGDIFAHVLDYLRYGSIELPPAIPKSSFERDLDFYGLVPEEGGIKHNSIADVMVSLRRDVDIAKSNLDDMKRKYDMFFFAFEVNHQYTIKETSSDAQESVYINVAELNVSSISTGRSNGYLSDAENKLLLRYLDEYFGLNSGEAIPSLNANGGFFVTRK